jgi:hypothetical protein
VLETLKTHPQRGRLVFGVLMFLVCVALAILNLFTHHTPLAIFFAAAAVARVLIFWFRWHQPAISTQWAAAAVNDSPTGPRHCITIHCTSYGAITSARLCPDCGQATQPAASHDYSD